MGNWIKRTSTSTGKHNRRTKSVNLGTGQVTNSWSQKMGNGRRTVTERNGKTIVTVTERNGLGTRRTSSVVNSTKRTKTLKIKRKKMSAREKKFWWFVIKWSFILWCINIMYQSFIG